MRTIILLVMAVTGVWRASACDVCGCSSPGTYLGILPQYQKHFIGLSYQSQRFHSTHPIVDGAPVPGKSDDYFNSITAWGRFYPSRRLQLFAFVPYHFNYVKDDKETITMQGLGDISVIANYMLVNTADNDTSGWKHTLLAGGGIKMPVGRNDHVNSEGIVLSNMQPGSGSWDFLFNLNYTLRYNSIGLNTEANYRIPTVNKRDYRYGDKLNVGISTFYWYEAKGYTLLPRAGVRYEYSQTDHSSYKYRIENPYSGGYQLYVSPGIAVYWQRFGLTGSCSIPVSEHYAGGLVKASARYECHIQYLF